MIKKSRYYLSWILFGIGDLTWEIMTYHDGKRWVSFWMPVYDVTMTASSIVQGKGLGPWSN